MPIFILWIISIPKRYNIYLEQVWIKHLSRHCVHLWYNQIFWSRHHYLAHNVSHLPSELDIKGAVAIVLGIDDYKFGYMSVVDYTAVEKSGTAMI